MCGVSLIRKRCRTICAPFKHVVANGVHLGQGTSQQQQLKQLLLLLLLLLLQLQNARVAIRSVGGPCLVSNSSLASRCCSSCNRSCCSTCNSSTCSSSGGDNNCCNMHALCIQTSSTGAARRQSPFHLGAAGAADLFSLNGSYLSIFL